MCQISPLNGLIAPQQLITHLDDVELHDSHTYKHWDNYLLSEFNEDRKYDNLGFCVSESMYTSRPEDCCMQEYQEVNGTTVPTMYENHQVCYLRSEREQPDSETDKEGKDWISRGHCLDPGEILNHPRCTTSCTQENEICVHPARSANLLRITTRNNSNGAEEVILYRGKKDQLWNDVKVGRYAAYLKSLQSLPLDIEIFWL